MEPKELKEMGQQKASWQIAVVFQLLSEMTTDFAGQLVEKSVAGSVGMQPEGVGVKK